MCYSTWITSTIRITIPCARARRPCIWLYPGLEPATQFYSAFSCLTARLFGVWSHTHKLLCPMQQNFGCLFAVGRFFQPSCICRRRERRYHTRQPCIAWCLRRSLELHQSKTVHRLQLWKLLGGRLTEESDVIMNGNITHIIEIRTG